MNKKTQIKTNCLWTPKDVAEHVGYKTPVSVLRAWHRGELVGFKMNCRCVRFHPDDVQRWIEAAREGG